MATEVLDREKLINAIWQYKGKVALVAEAIGVTAPTIYNYANKYATVKNALETAQKHNSIRRVDLAETKLEQAILAGERWAIAHTLNNDPEAKARDWGARTEIKHSGGITVNLSWGDDGDA